MNFGILKYGLEQGVSAVFVRITPPCVSFS